MIALLSVLIFAAAVDSAAAPPVPAIAPAAVDSASTRMDGAGAPRDSVVLTLPEVRVERERSLSEARRRLPTAFVTELPAGRSNRAIESLSEVLAQAAGVRIQQYGGLGAFSTVSLRGAPAGQVSVFLDGEPLGSAAHGVVNLADLPVTAIERVEVYRGLAPLGLGVATPGGAINLVTASGAELREARVARGSFGTWEGRASAGSRRGPLAAMIHAGVQSSRGDFGYWSDNNTPFDPSDDHAATRVNDRFDAGSALGSLTWTPRRGYRATLREDFFRKAQGLSGLGASPAQNPSLRFARSITHLEVAREAGRRIPGVRLGGGLQREHSRFRDTGGEFHVGELGLGPHASDDHVAAENVDVTLEWPRLARWLSLQTAASARSERADLSDAADGVPDPPQSRRLTRGAMLGLELTPLGDRLTLHAARRWDRLYDRLRSSGVGGALVASDVVRELDSPQLGARLQVIRGLEVRANWARASRAPDFMELFGNQGSVLGNPALRPERAENRDVGLAWSGALPARAHGALEWAHFESRPRDLIVYMRNSQNNVRAQNVSSARIRGEELTARLTPRTGIAVMTSLTWQSAINLDTYRFWTGRRLPQRPGRQAYARLDLERGRVRAAADVQYIADNYLDPRNTYRVASRTLVGASLSLAAFSRAARVVLEGKNLGNSHVSDVGGFPLPGRSVFVSLDLRLGPAGPARQP